MLLNLHVENLALIDEIDVEFAPGLNILTGETGAGKSIIIGSIGIALGKKISRDMIRKDDKRAIVELTFETKNTQALDYLKSIDIDTNGGCITISRKVTDGRSVNKINGESCSVSQIKETAAHLLDIHGQHEHQSLLYREQQLQILDAYDKDGLSKLKEETAECYHAYSSRIKALKEFEIDEESRKREISFLGFEIEEIEEAGLVLGEDEELESRYKKMVNAKRLLEGLSLTYELTGYEKSDGAGNQIGRALKEVQGAAAHDDALESLLSQATDIDGLLNDFNRELAEYLSTLQFEDEDFRETESRLDLLNQLKAKYGRTLSDVFAYREAQEKKLQRLTDFEKRKKEAENELREAETKLSAVSDRLSKKRAQAAKRLTLQITEELRELNFAEVDFNIEFERAKGYGENGIDEIEFMISTNPGEAKKPLKNVASGGELSRIMLAIKTILADRDETETLIFDEIDTGISGRTAQLVAQKMAKIGRHRQVLCITHLAQIAAMADAHYVIEKLSDKTKTTTNIRRLGADEETNELSRILGGALITESVSQNAKEMKALAVKYKEDIKH